MTDEIAIIHDAIKHWMVRRLGDAVKQDTTSGMNDAIRDVTIAVTDALRAVEAMERAEKGPK